MKAPVIVVLQPPKTDKIQPGVTKTCDDSTGFPFDKSDLEGRTRDRSFRTHIDDLVKRHPELAEHLSFDENFDRFPFNSNTWGHKRRSSSSSADESKPSRTADPESRRFGRPFGSSFEERFGFPFSRTFDSEPRHFYDSKSHENPVPPQQEQEEIQKPPQVPTSGRGRKQNPNIPQSSTVDLGHKQDPVQDTRGQRSMSAPPENRAGQQRFVSSINIPIHNDDNKDGNTQQTPPQSQQAQSNKTTERVIPIHVEGRDEPVLPKQTHQQTFATPPSQPRPQADRTFGQRPFGQWNRNETPYFTNDPQFFQREPGFFSEEPEYFKNRAEPQKQPNVDQYFTGGGAFQPQPQPFHHQSQRQTPPPQPQQTPPPSQQPRQTPPPQQQQQRQHSQTPPPQPPSKLGPIEQIQCIQRDVLELMNQVEKFNGKPKDKLYLYLDEMLTRNLLKLDDVETEGKENIRQARKEAINCIQRCISILEAKAAANEQLRNQFIQVDAKLEAPAPSTTDDEPNPGLTTLEVSGVSRAGTENISNGDSTTPMEVETSSQVQVDETENKTTEQGVDSTAVAENMEQTKDLPNADEQPAEVEQSNDVTNASEQSVECPTQETNEGTEEEITDKKDKKKVKKKVKKEAN